MAGNASRIFVAQMARLWLAPVGTVAPVDPVVAMGEGWYDVGLFTPDSLAFNTDPTFEQVRSHQSNYPTRSFQTEDGGTVEVDLQEWSSQNFKAVYGGGEVTTITGPPISYRFSPPQIGGRTETAACLEIIDGTKHYRRIIPRCQQQEGASQSFSKTAESTLPLRLTLLGADVGDPWYDLTDDPAMAPLP